MDFHEQLNYLIDTIGCSSKELVDLSGISNASLSRYKNGDRIPKYKSNQLEQLITGLSRLAKEKNITELNEAIIRKKLEKNIIKDVFNFEVFRNNLNYIINDLNINAVHLSKYIGFDPSYLSKIKSGEKTPQNTSEFAHNVCNYLLNNYGKEILINSTNIDSIELDEDILYNWITNNIKNNENVLDNFLTKLDEFDLNEYIKEIKFDKLKVPTVPFQLPKTKNYYGLKGYKDSQIDALKTVVLSKADGDIFFYSNIPMLEASEDINFKKKFMFGIAMILKKGLNLNMVHNLNRPFEELIIGLEGWIPIYMTGQIRPYYFKNNNDSIYSNFELISETVALSGSCINNDINSSKFHLTTKKDEVEFYKNNSKILLKKASSLMNIYKEENKLEFYNFLKNIDDNVTNIYNNLPIYTITDKLLNKILDNNNVDKKNKTIIKKYVQNEKEKVLKHLDKHIVTDIINVKNKNEFEEDNIALSLSKIFCDKKINYSYDEYLEHLKLTKQFKNRNYKLKIENNSIFKNINLSIIGNNIVIISKENNPAIHFVIHHPILVDAISKLKK